MSGSSPAAPAHTSVFNALGSYADRIKENANKPSSSGNASPNGPVATPSAPSSSAVTKQTPAARAPEPKSLTFPPADPEDDGPWETVQTGRQKPRNEDKRTTGSDSKNWRERAAPKEPVAEDDSWATVVPKAQKEAKAAPADMSSKPRQPTAATTAPGIGSKSVWGSLGGQSSNRTLTSSINPSPVQPVQGTAQESATPSSPSLNGTTATNNSTSPNMSSESTLPTSSPPNRPVTASDAPSTKPAPTPASKIAAAPTVNPWDERKKKMTPSASPTETPPSSLSSVPIPSSHTSSSSGRILQFGSVSPPQPSLNNLPNGDTDHTVKVTPSQKRQRGASSMPGLPVSTNTSLWPDIAQAAEVAKVTDEKKERVKERKDSDTSTAVEESPATGKKTKWTAIPADELQAAADEAAEARRRQAAAKRKAVKAESSTSPVKGKSRKSSMESRKGRSDSGSLRLPPMPSNATKSTTQTFRPVFGTATSDATSSVEEVATTMSAPLSRQTSRQSVGQSSRLSRTQLPSPSSQAVNLDAASMRLGAGPFGRNTHAIPSAPLPGPQFPAPNGAGQFTRPPRNREGRQSFSGPIGSVGRGGRGFRSSSAHRGPKGFTSPPGALRGLPSDSLYARGYGMGYGFVPQPIGPMTYGANAQYEAWNAQYPSQLVPQRGAMPPPPMPVTMVPGLDPLRVYVLGQVEYYFSMQNLAMDFFLRQQMDSEGWIDIPTIASFNRVKNLTADVPIVKEVMELSSLLEVREDKVRLAYGESKRWVLPEAKPSAFPADPLDSFQAMSPPSDAATAELAMSISGLGIEDMPGSGNMNGSAVGSLPKYASGEVENALMKSVPPSSAASVLNGDGSTGKGGETMTPATSASGDREEEEFIKEETTTT